MMSNNMISNDASPYLNLLPSPTPLMKFGHLNLPLSYLGGFLIHTIQNSERVACCSIQRILSPIFYMDASNSTTDIEPTSQQPQLTIWVTIFTYLLLALVMFGMACTVTVDNLRNTIKAKKP